MRPFLILVLAILAADAVRADAPPAPPAAQPRHCSLNGRWCLEPSASQSKELRIVERATHARSGSGWTLPAPVIGWPAVTNDGLCVIDAATSSNLIPADKSPADPAFVFHCKGRPAVVLSLDKFIVDFRALPNSTSHRVWAESFGLDKHDRLSVRTAEGRDFLIDPHDVKLIKGTYAH